MYNTSCIELKWTRLLKPSLLMELEVDSYCSIRIVSRTECTSYFTTSLVVYIIIECPPLGASKCINGSLIVHMREFLKKKNLHVNTYR